MPTKWDRRRQRVGQRANLRYAKRRRWAAWFWLLMAVSTTTLLGGLVYIIVMFWLSERPFIWETTTVAGLLLIVLIWMLAADGRAWRDATRYDEEGNEWHERR